jgi:(2Fe-2S) ferredoxin
MGESHEHCVDQPYEQSELRWLDQVRFHIFVCTDGKSFCGCESAGSGELVAALRREIARRRLLARCKVTIMQCRQQGAAGPVLVVHPDGVWYEGLTTADVGEFVESQILRGEPLRRALMQRPLRGVTAVPAHLAADR